MNTTFQRTEAVIRQEKKNVDRSIRALVAEMEHESTPLAETPLQLLLRVVKIFRSIRPLLIVLAGLPILPSTWSAVISMFIRVLDALSEGEVIAEFKAGRDLDT